MLAGYNSICDYVRKPALFSPRIRLIFAERVTFTVMMNYQTCKSSADLRNSAVFDIFRVILEICSDPRRKYFCV